MDQKDHGVIPNEPIKKLRNKSCLAINGDKSKYRPKTYTLLKKNSKEVSYSKKTDYSKLKPPTAYSPYKTTHKHVKT
jgi:hypothetical protein